MRKGEPFVKKMRQVFDERRLLLVDGLRRIGLPVAHRPQGAYYVFANASKFGAGSLELAYKILYEAHVAVTPGVDFGKGGEGYLRFSYANSLENIKKGLRSLEKFLKTNR